MFGEIPMIGNLPGAMLLFKVPLSRIPVRNVRKLPRFSNDQTTQDLHPNFKLKTAEWSAALGSLDPSVNEAVVLHGTSPELLPQILENGVSATE